MKYTRSRCSCRESDVACGVAAVVRNFRFALIVRDNDGSSVFKAASIKAREARAQHPRSFGDAGKPEKRVFRLGYVSRVFRV